MFKIVGSLPVKTRALRGEDGLGIAVTLPLPNFCLLLASRLGSLTAFHVAKLYLAHVF